MPNLKIEIYTGVCCRSEVRNGQKRQKSKWFLIRL